jgi:uncharacterized protein
MEQTLRDEIIRRLYKLPCDGAHEVDHIIRVSKLAIKIAKTINCEQLDLVELVALTHEVGDRKLTPGLTMHVFLDQLTVPYNLDKLQLINSSLAWSKGPLDETKFTTDEVKVIYAVTDADKIEALGATGVARCVIYSGAHGTPIMNDKQPRIPCNRDDYLKEPSSSVVNHMFEKLLLLPDHCKTEYGTLLAEKRKTYMVNYLLQLHDEIGILFPRIGYKIVHPKIHYRTEGMSHYITFDYTFSDDKIHAFVDDIDRLYKPEYIYTGNKNNFSMEFVSPSVKPIYSDLQTLSLDYPSNRLLRMFKY